MPKIQIFPDDAQLAQAAAKAIIDFGLEKIENQGRFTLTLSGGSTPKATYRLLPEMAAARKLDWRQVYVLFGDERCVPPDHPDSNYGMARHAFLDHIDIPQENILPMLCTVSPDDAAIAYEEELRELLTNQWDGRLDLILLGLGTNAHTASLFPGSTILDEKERLVLPAYIDELESWRLTLTPPALNSAERVMFLVEGEAKAEAAAHVFEDPYDPSRWPAQVVQPDDGLVEWFMDQAAASRLEF
jgi:6-phosphogluconolactonase